MLNIDKILNLCDCSFETCFLDEYLTDEFSNFEELTSYLNGDSGYISDLISEYADSNTSIYYSDIEEFGKNNMDRVNQAISEFGWEGCGSDLHKAMQMGEYCENQENAHTDVQNFKEWIEENYEF